MPENTTHPLPAGYTLVDVAPASADARRRRPISEWRRTLEHYASTQAGRDGAWQRRIGNGGTDELSLAARGALRIARHRTRPNIYSITPRGLAALEEARR